MKYVRSHSKWFSRLWLTPAYGVLAAVLLLGNVACPMEFGVIRVVNNSTQTIDRVNISPCSDTRWGIDELIGTIGPGESHTFTDVAAGCQDIRVISTIGEVAEQYRIILPSGGEVTFTVTDEKKSGLSSTLTQGTSQRLLESADENVGDPKR